MAPSLDRTLLQGSEAEVFKLVIDGATPSQWAKWLRVPLEHALAQGNEGLVTKLLDAGAKPRAGWRGCNGRTLMAAAAQGGSERCVLAMLRTEAKEELNVKFGVASKVQSALSLAINRGSEDAARMLLIAGADAHFVDCTGRGPLHFAAWGGQHRLVGDLLLRGACPNATDNKGDAPLHLAACSGHAKIVAALLAGGADIDLPGTHDVTPLYRAVNSANLHATEELLAAGADVMLSYPRYKEGATVVHLAAHQGDEDVLKALLKYNADATTPDVDGLTPLHYAGCIDNETMNDERPRRRDNAGIVRVLLAAGADIHARDKHGVTPLHHAHLGGSASIGTVLALLQEGADVNRRTHGNFTPLHFACFRNDCKAAELLLRWGADEMMRDGNNGRTPAEVIGIGRIEYDPHLDSEGDRLRSILARAPADRTWRRRGWLVMFRCAQDKAHPQSPLLEGNQGMSSGEKRPCIGLSSARATRMDEEGEGSKAVGVKYKKVIDLARLVARVAGLESDGIFRDVVSFL